MMRQTILATAAILALAACNPSGSGPQLPPVQAGAQAPVTLSPPTGTVQQAQVTEEVRQQLITQIGQYLDQYAGQFASGMARPTGFTDQIGPMQPGTDSRFVMELTGGTPYAFLGACDGDCTNVDIELIDMRTGGVVASDMLPDDYPVVNFTPQANGQYMVRTILQTCTVAPCYTGMRALTQAPSGAGGAK
jgi:hypothetical protein